jgi:hypothetical protein
MIDNNDDNKLKIIIISYDNNNIDFDDNDDGDDVHDISDVHDDDDGGDNTVDDDGFKMMLKILLMII